jgi:SMI1 / KNR4 family (SUKH-1)/Ankyrin repeats (3 copies)
MERSDVVIEHPILVYDFATMYPELIDSFGPVTEAEIQQFERDLNIELPEDYRQFLVKNNGGHFCDEVCNENFTCVDSLFGLVPARLQGYFADLRRVPFFDAKQTLLRIGDNGLGDELLLRVVGVDYGTVWIHHVDFDPDDDETTVRAVAPSFDGFLNGLRLHPDRDMSKESDPVFRSIEDGDEEEFYNLFRAEDVEKRSDHGERMLSFASANCRLRIMRRLLEAGAQIESEGWKKETPLFAAIRGQTVDAARLLIEYGANVNAVNADGDSVLMVAFGVSNKRGALLLIESGADVNYRTPNGKSVSDCVSIHDTLPRSWLDSAK